MVDFFRSYDFAKSCFIIGWWLFRALLRLLTGYCIGDCHRDYAQLIQESPDYLSELLGTLKAKKDTFFETLWQFLNNINWR